MPSIIDTLLTNPNLSYSGFDTSREHALEKWARPAPALAPFVTKDGEVIGVENLGSAIEVGSAKLYDKRFAEPDKAKLFSDGKGGYNKIYNDHYVNTDGLTEISYNELRKSLPKRDYIGGNNDRITALMNIPGLTNLDME